MAETIGPTTRLTRICTRVMGATMRLITVGWIWSLFAVSAYAACSNTRPVAEITPRPIPKPVVPSASVSAVIAEPPKEEPKPPQLALDHDYYPIRQWLSADPSLVGPPVSPWPFKREPQERYRILIIGDSMAATDFGRELQKRLRKNELLQVRKWGKSATGLARPDFFNWFEKGAKLVNKYNPDLVVVIIGGNDGQDLIDAKRKKRRIIWNSRKWNPSYSDRIAQFSTLLAPTPRQKVLWVELPVMDKSSLEKKLKKIRAIQKTTLAKMSSSIYLDTRPWFFTKSKKLRTKIRVRQKRVALRQDDGIHFTVAGAKWFAQKVAPKIVKTLGALSKPKKTEPTLEHSKGSNPKPSPSNH